MNYKGDSTDSLEGRIILNDSSASTSSSTIVWVMEFDGSCTSMGSGVGVVFISPDGEFFTFSYKL